jgi:hypothetical protein
MCKGSYSITRTHNIPPIVNEKVKELSSFEKGILRDIRCLPNMFLIVSSLVHCTTCSSFRTVNTCLFDSVKWFWVTSFAQDAKVSKSHYTIQHLLLDWPDRLFGASGLLLVISQLFQS